ncbi:hypothetical protein Tco_1047470, partial [Tanacetum coccineum]
YGNVTALLETKTRKAIKASRRDYRFHQETSGSSKGAGITPEFLDKPKDKSTDTNEGEGITPEVPDVSKAISEVQDMDEEDWGSDEDDVILSSDDERIESEKETTESGKTDENSDDEEEHVKDDYVPGANNVHDDVEKCDDVNVEMKDAEIAEENKEKGDTEQAVNDQAVKDAQVMDDDQATTTVPVAQKEKPNVPPLSSSLSISSYYGTQFLNLSSDFSLIGITKESADTEINSMLDIQIQQKITTVQSPTLLVVPVLVIPEQSIPTPTPSQQVPIVTSSTLIIQQSTQIPTPPPTS